MEELLPTPSASSLAATSGCQPSPAMNPTTSRAEALFMDALALPLPQRAAFLDRACDGDTALRVRLNALLAAHESAASLLDTPAAGQTVGSFGEEKPGEHIGRYKLLQKIGEGGCGVVWMAEQEEPVRRRVALKVIKLGMDTKAVVARFEAERQALAMMDHPNIAKVHDAGATETGRPFFVMELVRGIPITKYCDENQLTPVARLELFIKVCHAIQHAHQKGVIHRDIKPSNILVTVNDGQPTPKVIDFGIAKATQGKLTDATIFTAFEQFIGTPIYMSPEQAEMSSLDIDTRSDIYSLGVLLYELLTGRPPFDPKKFAEAGVEGIRQQIREVEPPRPSARLSTLDNDERTTIARLRNTASAELSLILRGDLDWIVMRCIEKDRTRRYDTANALAADIHRYLRNEPVIARPPSTAYLLQKLIRRHRVAFGAAAAIAFVVIVGGIGSAWLAIRATRAERDQVRLRLDAEAIRNLAAAGRRQAENLLTFVFTDLADQLNTAGQVDALQQISDRTVTYYESLPAALQTRDTRATHAFALAGAGALGWSSSDTSIASSWGQQASRSRLERATRIFEELEATGPLTAFMRVAFAGILGSRGGHFLEAGRFLDFIPYAERAEKLLHPALDDPQWGGWAHRIMARLLEGKGWNLVSAGEGRAALPDFERAVVLANEADRRIVGVRRPGLHATLITTYRAEAFFRLGERVTARELQPKVRLALREILDRDPSLLSVRWTYTAATAVAAQMTQGQWRFDEAQALLREAQSNYVSLRRLDPRNTAFQINLSWTWAILAFDRAWLLHEFPQAVAATEEAVRILSEEGTTPFARGNLLAAHLRLARVSAAMGQDAVADRHLALADMVRDRLVGERGLTGPDLDLLNFGHEAAQRSVGFERLEWRAMRQGAEHSLGRIERAAPAGQYRTRYQAAEQEALHQIIRAAFEMGDYAAANAALEKWRAGAETDGNADLEQRFNRVDLQLTRIHVQARAGLREVALAELSKIWAEIDDVFTAGPNHLFNQIQTARALSIRAEIDGSSAEKRLWLERAAAHLRPAGVEGKLTRYEREVLLAGIEKQLTRLNQGEKR
jgi:serine/threonine protein kinase/tetratricopeptide (TPR) repeat protein